MIAPSSSVQNEKIQRTEKKFWPHGSQSADMGSRDLERYILMLYKALFPIPLGFIKPNSMGNCLFYPP